MLMLFINYSIPIFTYSPCPQFSGDSYTFEYNSSRRDYYVAMRRSPSDSRYLDVYLEAVAAGWVAIGFSRDTHMVRRSNQILCIIY